MSVVHALATQRYSIKVQDGGPYNFDGVKLGFGTSRRRSHINHHPGSPPPPGTRCSGCRWTDTTIYWSASDRQYVVYILGRSTIPGEHDKIRVVWANDADAVLDGMLISPPRHISRASNAEAELELPQPNAHALEEAAEHDSALANVFAAWQSGN